MTRRRGILKIKDRYITSVFNGGRDGLNAMSAGGLEMVVHFILHRWSDDGGDGCEISQVYRNMDEAKSDMYKLADAERQKVRDEFEKEFDADFCEECDVLIQFGWYGQPLHCDCTWNWSVESREVC